jgi:subtilisin-like proprotein convertase family protein
MLKSNSSLHSLSPRVLFTKWSSSITGQARRLLLWAGAVLLGLSPWLLGLPGSQAAKPVEAKSAGAPAVQVRAYRSAGPRHKLRIADPVLRQRLLDQGARALASYGAEQLLSVDESLLQSLAGQAAAQAIVIRDEEDLLLLKAGVLDTALPAVQEARALRRQQVRVQGAAGKALHLVQFVGPVKPEWYAELAATGVQIISYLPHNAYLVYGEAETLARVQNWAQRSPVVQWDGVFEEPYKLDPNIHELRAELSKAPAAQQPELFALQLVNDPTANQDTLALINALRVEPIKSQFRVLNYLNVIVRLPLAAVEKGLVGRRDILSIARYVVPVKQDERQNLILTGNLSSGQPVPGDYLTYLNNQGLNQSQFTASNFIVNVSDSGIDNATSLPNHFGLYLGGQISGSSRIAYNRLEGTPNQNSTLQGCDGHGTLNAHIIGGFVPTGAPYNTFPHADGQGFRWGLGVAPFVRLGSTVIFDPRSYTFPDFKNIEARAYQDGARISSNSWGSPVNGAYTIDAQAYDALVRDAQPTGAPVPAAGNQEQVIVFSAGNGAVSGSIGAPGSAKNVITVGAAESVNTIGGTDGCNVGDDQANNANDIANFSSRGPTQDGRRKPDLVAPGTHITGGVYQAASPDIFGTAAGCYLSATFGISICGGPGGVKFHPSGQQFYTSSSGTSHAAPAVAGAAALLRQRFINAGLTPPSPAMTKAVLMQTARYMTGGNVSDSLWSFNQGMGEVNLTSLFGLFGQQRVLRDQVVADIFTASGQLRSFSGTVADPSKPFRVTLAWTDAPGPLVGSAFVNNLDLEVTVNGESYKGNVFSGAISVAGGLADGANNVESVYLPAGLTGSYVVTVKATNIAGDGVPNFGGALDQDFALVITNGTQTSQAVITGAGATLTAENCTPNNNAIDPGETVTLNLALQNIGSLATSNLVATLQPTGGVINPSAAQSYGALPAASAPVSRSFSFTALGTCGGTLTATLALQDGATNLGTVSYTLNLGQQTASTVNFTSAGGLTIPVGAPTTTTGPASPYPSNLNVSGVTGTVSKITVTLNGATHTNPDDLDILLVGPTGQRVLLMSDAGGDTDLNNVTFTLNDTAPSLPNATAITTGSYAPTNYGDGDTFPLPAPTGPYGEPSLAVFNGLNPNGVWSLYLVDDADGDTGSLSSWTLNITTTIATCCSSTNCGTITVSPSTIPPANVGTAYAQSFTQTGGTGAVSFGITGTLPLGLSFTPAGLLSGTPTQTGTFPLTVSVVDAQNCLGMRSYNLLVGSLSITTASLPDGRLGQPYTQNFAAAGGTAPLIWNLAAGTPPPGMAINGNGSIFGTPTQAGTFNFTIRVTDAQSLTAQKAFTLKINRANARADFDGDGRTDLSVWRGSDGNWLTLNSSNNALQTQQWGAGYAPYFDTIVPGDYDGDGKTDHAIWRGQDSIWYIRKSSDGQPLLRFWGANYAPYFDVPTPGDYDGDGKTDLAVWRRDGTWFVWKSSNGAYLIETWGQSGDTPVPGDYDGDGRTDLAVWRGADGTWLIKRSSGGTQTIQWGAGYAPYFDVPVQADYDGDGQTDLAIWRGADSLWYIRQSSDGQPRLQLWGANYAPYFDVPTPGDYDGDGKADIAVWRRDGTWYVLRSSNGSFLIQTHGQTSDVPVPAYGVK